jgi:predicted flap endonuclease-1-like 5' DNA nuclease
MQPHINSQGYGQGFAAKRVVGDASACGVVSAAITLLANPRVTAANTATQASFSAPATPPVTAHARPPKAPPPRKAAHAAECERLEQLPNIGPSLAADLRTLGVQHPHELLREEAFDLYRRLCSHAGKRQDPCVLDTFLAAVDFMRGAQPRPWWTYTALRKAVYGAV